MGFHIRFLSQRLGLLASGIAALGFVIAQSSAAALPKVLDHVPVDAIAVLALPSVSQLDKSARDLLGALEMPTMSTPAQVLAVMGLGQGLDMNRSAAVVVLGPDQGAGAAEDAGLQIVGLIPTTDFKALLASFNPTDVVGGAKTFTVNGQQLFARAIADGYALVATNSETLAGFNAAAGALGAHQAAIGAAGKRVADASDVFVIIGPTGMAMLTQQAMTAINGQAGMAAMMAGANPENIQAQIRQAQALLNSVISQASGAIVGLRAGALGASLDVALTFKPDSDPAQTLQARGDAHQLLTHLPDDAFLFAGAGDYTSESIKGLFQQLKGLAGGAIPAGAGDAIQAVDGQAFAVYTTAGGLLTGLFANSMDYSATKNPKALVEFTKNTLNAENKIEDSPFTGGFEENAADVAGKKAHKWSLQMNADAGGFGPQQQVLGALFGQMGLSGYMAAVKEGVISSLAPTTDSLAKAIELSNGNGRSLSDNAVVTAIARELPDGRTAEGYVNVGELLRQALVIAATFLGQVNLEVAPNLPPVGLGLTTDAAAVRVTTFMPTPVIKTLVHVSQVISQMQAGAGGGGRPPF